MKKIIYGREKAREYREISNEIEGRFDEWLRFSQLSVEMFEKYMAQDSFVIDDKFNEDGSVEIAIYAGGLKLGSPFIYFSNEDYGLDEFIVTLLLLLLHIAAKSDNKNFRNEVEKFKRRLVENNKMEK